MIRNILKAIAEIVRWYFSEEHSEDVKRGRNAAVRKAVYVGDEAKVNERIAEMGLAAAVMLAIVGCVGDVVYVRERDKVKALKVGEAYTNESQAVEWVVPPAIMTKLITEVKR